MDDVLDQSGASEHRNIQLEAYEALLPEIQSVPLADILTINIDVATTVTTVLGAHGQIIDLRPRLAKLTEFDLAKFDKLPSYAHATSHAQGDYMVAVTPPESLPQLAEEAAVMRDLLLSSATTLAKYGLINGEALGSLKGANGYRNVAMDLTALSNLLRHHLSRIVGKSPVTPEDIENAAIMSARLMTGVGVKERTPAAIAEVSLTRQRAFTLLVRVYDHMRRGVSYLRWDEGDVDTIAPSLYAGRNTARRRSGTDIPTTPETPVPPVGTTPSTPTAPIPPVPIGHQGGSPLMS